MTLKQATVFALTMSSVTLVADIVSWIPRFQYLEARSWLLVLKHFLWMTSLIAFFSILLKNQLAREKAHDDRRN